MDTLRLRGEFKFEDIVAPLLQAYMLRETDVKNICVELAADRRIENTWGKKPNKPKGGDIIRLPVAK